MNRIGTRDFGKQKQGWLLGAVILFALMLLSGCSSGGGGGISGTGVQTQVTGTVTGFGSVVIGGIHYTAAPGASVLAEGAAVAEADLRQGMVVVLKGAFDSATGTGTYDTVSYRADLEGPVSSADALTGSFSLLGQQVLVDAATVFDGVADLAALPDGSLVEVSGAIDPQGGMHAARVVLKKGAIAANDPVRVKGRVGAVGTGSFSIGSQLVTYAAGQTAFVNLSPGDLSTTDNRLVEVSGTLNGSVVSATRLERLEPVAGATSGERIDISGFIVSGDAAGFVLNSPNGPITISGGSAVVRNGTVADVLPGRKAEVTGTLSGNLLVAAVIELEHDNTVKLEGDVSAVDRAGSLVVLNGVEVAIAGQTLFKDSSNASLRSFGLADIAIGDHLQIGGFVDVTASPVRVVATRLERLKPSATTFIQGPVSQLAPQVVILGLPITVTGETTFTKGGVGLGSFGAFSAQVTLNSTVVRAKGSFTSPPAQLTATELEIQP